LSTLTRWRASIHAGLPRTLTLSADPLKPAFGISIPCNEVACNVDTSETMDAAGQLGADAAVPSGSGRFADRGAGHDPAGSATGSSANACGADTRAASSRAAGPLRAISSEQSGKHAGRSRHRACSLRYRDPTPNAATGAASSGATTTNQSIPCTRTPGALACSA
jgi:hypothetical protein